MEPGGCVALAMATTGEGGGEIHKLKPSHILFFMQCAGKARRQCDGDTVPWPTLSMHTGEYPGCAKP